MFRQKLYTTSALLAGIGLVALSLYFSGAYPAAMVQGRFISAGKFRSEYRAASSYYEKVQRMYGKLLDPNQKLSPQDIELGVMNQIIEDTIVRDEAEREIGANLNNLLQEKIGKYENDADLAKAAAAIYGLDRKSFSDDILIPQAMREILTSQLALKDQKFDDWLAVAKKSASITIFSLRFTWDGEKVSRK